MANFWTNAVGRDPKRKFRFLLTIASLPEGAQWFVKTSDRPSLEVAHAEHKFLNHTFYYPGSVTWNEINVVLVDPVDPDMQYALADVMRGSGYYVPTRPTSPKSRNTTTISKNKAVSALNNVKISMIDSDGIEIETWTLHGAWIAGIENSNLEYGSEDLAETTIKFKYDWAELVVEGQTPGSTDAQYGTQTPNIAPTETAKNATPGGGPNVGGDTVPGNKFS